MLDNIESFKISEGIIFNKIETDKFKTGRICFNILTPLKKETASANAVAIYSLKNSCQKYKTGIELNKELNSLYGAGLSVNVSKLGETQVLSVSAQGINENYVIDKNTSISSKLALLICEVIFNPNVSDNFFNKEAVLKAKSELIDILDARYSDKRVYSKIRCNELMCEGEAYSVSSLGKKEDISKLNETEVYKAWKKLLQESKVEITALGKFKFEEILNNFKESFKKIDRNYKEFSYTNLIDKPQKMKYHEDNMNLSQAKLVLGFRALGVKSREEKMAFRLMCAILGGTAHSKLFLNVREKLSLCYYCSSSFEAHKGLMFIESGVEDDNIQKAKGEILNQIDSIKNGDITEEEIKSNKLSLINIYKSISDSLVKLEDFYTSQTFESEQLSPEECAKCILRVNKDQIINAANTLNLNMIYVLTE